MSIRDTVTGVSYDALIADSSVPALTKIVTLTAGQGILARGTILGITTSTGNAVVVKTGATDGSAAANCILADDNVDTTNAAVNATAYVSGVFTRDLLTVSTGDTVAVHEEELRDKSIYLTKISQ
ncbi:head decoration protein [Pectinatus frisingensis]|uniref:head decoration protein n=1 Tax=Pectinatus frisingensis TaxID=865 RepID=UPI0018C68623|nr:head decoration protein [Pectinatus frisingensis]